MRHYDVDVLIAGAGPVGLMAALQLARRGVSVRLVDAANGPAMTSRALGTHARSLEIYDQLGILGDIAPHGTRVNAFIRHHGDRPARVDFDFDGLATRFPYMFDVDQVITERVLRGHVGAAGVGVEWGTRLESLRQDDDAVTAVLRREDSPDGSDTPGGPDGSEAGRETVRARYLWGCDGGHSVVRKTLELPLIGEPAHSWLIADAVVHTDLQRDGVHWLFPGGGALMAFPFPEPGKWRLLDTTGDGDASDPVQVAQQFRARLSTALESDTVVETPSWVSKFTIQQRAVPTMHVGRCFVSGDAAHVHSPASGQGLNTGIQDAYNLAWKLAMVVHGQADTALLDTYDAERVPIGQALLASTGEVMDTAMVATPATATAAQTQDADSAFARKLIQNMSGLMIAYTGSPLTLADEQPGSGPRPGQRLTQVSAADAAAPGWVALRALMRTAAWHLLTFVGSETDVGQPDRPDRSDPLPPWLDEVTISQDRNEADGRVWDPDGRVRNTVAAAAGDWILVRPDGYLSARGSGDVALRTALDRLPGLRVREQASGHQRPLSATRPGQA